MLWLAGIMSTGGPINFLESFFLVDGVTLASVWSAFGYKLKVAKMRRPSWTSVKI